MFGSEILDVALGMVFVFLLLSLVASAVRETFESFIRARAVHLERGLKEMLDDPDGSGLTKELFEHPLMFSLVRGTYNPKRNRFFGANLPTYIPARTFAVTLLDIFARGPTLGPESTYPNRRELTVEQIRSTLDAVLSARVKRAVLLAMDGAGDDVAKVRQGLEQWFNDSMDRVSASYRRRTQYGLFAIAIVVTLGLNVDSIAIANHIWRNKTTRQALAARAEAFVRDSATANAILTDSTRSRELLNRQVEELEKLALPIGWSARPAADSPNQTAVKGWFSAMRSTVSSQLTVSKVFGLLITVFAITLGAPFWFDALKRIMVIRSTVKTLEGEGKKGETLQGSGATTTAATPPRLRP